MGCSEAKVSGNVRVYEGVSGLGTIGGAEKPRFSKDGFEREITLGQEEEREFKEELENEIR